MNRVCIGDRNVGEDVFVVLCHAGLISGVTAHEDRYIATADGDGLVMVDARLSLKAVLAGPSDDVTISVFHPVDELIATV